MKREMKKEVTQRVSIILMEKGAMLPSESKESAPFNENDLAAWMRNKRI